MSPWPPRDRRGRFIAWLSDLIELELEEIDAEPWELQRDELDAWHDESGDAFEIDHSDLDLDIHVELVDLRTGESLGSMTLGEWIA
tara:strand:+ start:81 stop:338 length:258 start_codon:yes stop_codon:yes gene_type:complete